MIVIASIDALGLNVPENGINDEEFVRTVESALESAYDAAARDAVAEEPPYAAGIYSLKFGAEEPNEIRKKARGWNSMLTEKFIYLTNRVIQRDENGNPKIEVDTKDTYALMLSAHEIDNSFHPMATYGAIMDGESIKHTLSTDDIEDIDVHPEKYLTAEIIVRG